jgi:hypothetical protein
MKDIMASGIKTLDYFAQPIQITFNQKSKFPTVMGGFLSVIIYSVTIVLMVSSASNLLNRVNPKTTMTSTVMDQSPLLNLTEMNLIYAITFMNRNFEPIYDPTLFTMEWTQFKREKQSDGSILTQNIPIQTTNCEIYQEEFIKRGYGDEFVGNNVKLGSCFDNQKTQMVIGGDFNQDYFSNINFKVKRCVNSSKSEVVCKSKEEIDDKLLNSYFQLFYFDFNVDVNNYAKPYELKSADYYIVLDPKASKFVDIYFKTVNITTDAGMIFQSNVYDSAVVFDYYRDQILVQVVDDLVIDFYINSSKNYITYTRIYQKFQDLAASVGGLIKVMTLLGYFITIKFTHYEMYGKMFECLYNFDFDEEKKSDKLHKSLEESSIKKLTTQNLNKKNNSEININNFVNVTEGRKYFHPSSDINYQESSINNVILKRNKKNEYKMGHLHKNLNLNPLNVLKLYMCFCCIKKQKTKLFLFRKAFTKLHKYLDYLQIVQTLQQFHRLKNVIFTKSQKKLFTYQRKNLISENDNNKESNLKIKKSIKELKENSNNLHEIYLKAKKKENTNKIYKRIVRNMNENIKNMLEQHKI